jgi:hypothetical protein
VLRRVVSPLVGETTARHPLRGFFFERHWEGGPHIRLCLRTAGDPAGLTAFALRRARTLLARHASAVTMTQEAYLAMAERIAALEGTRSYDRTLHPSGGAYLAVYRPDSARFGTGPCLDAVEDHFTDASRIALDVVNGDLVNDQGRPHVRESQARRALVLACLMAVVLERAAGPLELGARARLTARSGASAVLGRPYRAAPGLLGHTAEHASLARARAPGPGDPVATWVLGTRRLAARLDALAATGSLDAVLVSWPPGPARTGRDAIPDLILEHCAHLLCNRLGVTPEEEAELRAKVAQTFTGPDGEPS